MQLNPKVFFIGFNKCGTKTLHYFFLANGYRSMHHRFRPLIYDYIPRRFWPRHTMKNAARLIENNISAGRPILRGLHWYRVYSDLTYSRKGRVIEACRHFRALHSACPDAYFVLNLRPVENWVRSRAAHDGGEFIRHYASLLSLSESAVKEEWRRMFAAHNDEVTAYFGESQRFMTFDIENNPPARLQALLKDDFELDLKLWKHMGATSPV